MKKLRNLVGVIAAMAMATVLTGCGGDDDDDDDDDHHIQIVAPADVGALTAPNNVYTVTIPGQAPIELRFPAAGQYQLTQGETRQTGTFSGAQRTDNTWTMNITPEVVEGPSVPGLLRLDFTAGNAGAWTFTPAGGQAVTGTFALSAGGGQTDGGQTDGGQTDGGQTDGGQTDGGQTDGGQTDGGQTGEPTTNDLSGRTLQLFYPTIGGGEKFQFTSANQASYEDGADTASYSYDPTGRTLTATRGQGQTYTVTFGQGGNATVVYQDSPNSTPQTDPATFTWQ